MEKFPQFAREDAVNQFLITTNWLNQIITGHFKIRIAEAAT